MLVVLDAMHLAIPIEFFYSYLALLRLVALRTLDYPEMTIYLTLILDSMERL
jgi:hypothetical protein